MGGHGVGRSLGGEPGLEVSILPALPCCNPSPFRVLEGAGDQSQRGQGREQPKGGLTSSVQGCPLAFALLDEGRGAVGRQHLHTLRRASLSGQEERSPALVVPHVQVHQRLSQRLQGFTVTVVGLEGRGESVDKAPDMAPLCSWGPRGDSGQQASPRAPWAPLRPLPACHIPTRRQKQGRIHMCWNL